MSKRIHRPRWYSRGFRIVPLVGGSCCAPIPQGNGSKGISGKRPWPMAIRIYVGVIAIYGPTKIVVVRVMGGLMDKIKDDGGDAFPVYTGYERGFNLGMSLRDWFAGQFLSGFSVSERYIGNPEWVAEHCYKYADAMIKERKK